MGMAIHRGPGSRVGNACPAKGPGGGSPNLGPPRLSGMRAREELGVEEPSCASARVPLAGDLRGRKQEGLGRCEGHGFPAHRSFLCIDYLL